MSITNKTNRTTLKGYFVKNAIPTEANFAELIDSCINQADDSIAKVSGEPVSLQPDASDSGIKKVLNFYKDFTDVKPAWTLSLNPRSNLADPNSANPGWSIGDADGNSKLMIDEGTGNIGIGNTNPNQKLHVEGNAVIGSVGEKLRIGHVGHEQWAGIAHEDRATASGYALIQNSSGLTLLNSESGQPLHFRIGNANKMVVSSSGNVGIGTTNPSRAKLHIRGGQTHELIAVNRPNSDTAALYLGNDGGNNAVITANNADLVLGRDFSGGFTEYLRIKNGTGNVGIGTESPSHKLHVLTSSAVGLFESTSNQAYLRVSTNEGLDNRIELANRSGGRAAIWTADAGDALNVTKTGNVGIGTTSPTQKLHVEGNAVIGSAGEELRIGYVGHNNYAGIAHEDRATASGYALIQESNGRTFLNSESDQPLHFRIGNTDKMFVSSGGNVGIGTTSPGQKLEVNGSYRLRGTDNYCDMWVEAYNLVFRQSKSGHGEGRAIRWDGDTNWDTYSDRKLKTNIKKEADILKRLLQLEVKNYQWKNAEGKDPKKIGFIAQDVQPLFPELVDSMTDPDTKETNLTLKYTSFGVLAVGGLKELKAEMDGVIAKQSKLIAELQKQIKQLTAQTAR